MRYGLGVMTVVIAVVCGDANSFAADQVADQKAIEKAIDSYSVAFNAKDAKALSVHWAPEAVYINPLTGNQVSGREAIEKEFAAILAELKDAKLAIEVKAIRFVSPSVAVEDGVARLIGSDGEPEETRCSAVHVKQGGKWLLDRVTEEDVQVVASHYEHLKELEWMIGTWVDKDERGRMETSCRWTRNKNFITRSFAVSMDDQIDFAGMQIIGWDPGSKQVRSWVFDSDGGFAEGRWAKNGNRWHVTMTGTLPSGGKASSVIIITYLDQDSFGWQSVNRMADGELLPNIEEVVVVRNDAAE